MSVSDGKATRLLGCNLKVTGQDDQGRRALRSDLGRLASQSPVPEVLIRSLALVEEHPRLTEDGVRALLHAARLSEGQATRSFVLALAGLYRLTRPCDAAELAAVTAVLPALRSQGVISCGVDWTKAQQRELRGRGVVQYEQWLVRSPDRRSKLSFSVQRQLSVQHDAGLEALLRGDRGLWQGCHSAISCPPRTACRPGPCSLRLAEHWPWAFALAKAFTRLRLIPLPA